jgi:ATP-binding cassette subfamily B protein RaxB
MVASFHGHRTDVGAMRRRFSVSMKGMTLRTLMRIAADMGLAGRALRFDMKHLADLRAPAILHWDLNHFVVLKEVTRGGIVIHDPASGVRKVSAAEAADHLSGIALELVPTEGFTRVDDRVRLPFSAFWGHLRGSGHALTQVFALSVVLEILVIAGPFYMQLVIDEVIARGSADLLLVLALGFGLLSAISVASTALRSQIVLIVQNALHFDMGARLFASARWSRSATSSPRE